MVCGAGRRSRSGLSGLVARHDRKYAIEVSASSVSRSEPSPSRAATGSRVGSPSGLRLAGSEGAGEFRVSSGRVGGLAHVVWTLQRDLVGQPPRTVARPRAHLLDPRIGEQRECENSGLEFGSAGAPCPGRFPGLAEGLNL